MRGCADAPRCDRPTGEGTARALFVFAHGAGAGQHHPFMAGVSRASRPTASTWSRSTFHTRDCRKSAPDRPPVLEQSFREVVDAARSWSAAAAGCSSAGSRWAGALRRISRRRGSSAACRRRLFRLSAPSARQARTTPGRASAVHRTPAADHPGRARRVRHAGRAATAPRRDAGAGAAAHHRARRPFARSPRAAPTSDTYAELAAVAAAFIAPAA